ncbi:arsenate reductase/protein-tyrosine-phosphatase family protein [Xanthobacter sp. TB0139]|uniref:arsenate reductase/protein-tyrosine-phosphatase family protein n=1 Tax=Xanthobacter sp. TB0139 TaxID=3459178 RepID=UPI00403A6F4E
MIGRHSILFLCRDNAGISLMAEAIAMHVSARLNLNLRAFSAAAGQTAPVDVVALECLHEAGVPADGLSSKPLELFALSGAPRVDVVVPLVKGAHHVSTGHPWLHRLRLRAMRFEDAALMADAHARRLAYRNLLPALRQAILELAPLEGAGMAQAAA